MPKRVLPVLLMAAALAGCAAPTAPDLAAAPEPLPTLLSWGAPVVVDSTRIASEPSVSVAADGTVFVAAPTGVIKYATRPQDAIQHLDKGIYQGAIWRSTDGGASFEFRAGLGPTPYHTAQPGGGDSDIAIGIDGRVYVTDQFGFFTEVVQWSDDNGETWQGSTLPASGEPPVDRQWLTVDPEDASHVYLHYNKLGEGFTVSESRDGGASWSARLVSERSAPSGRGLALPGGWYGFSAATQDGVVLVHTMDGGASWQDLVLPVDTGEVVDFFPSTFADSDGTIYVSWMQASPRGAAVVYTASPDRGATWTPLRVAHEQAGYGTFSWGVAGGPGRLAFVWYGAEDPDAAWYVESVVVTDALGEAPNHAYARVDAEPIRTGRPCESGSTCTSGRELGDFFEATITPGGRLVVAYVRVLSPEAGGRVVVAVQDAGDSLWGAGGSPTPWTA